MRFPTLLILAALGLSHSALAQDAYEAGITLSPDEKYVAVGSAKPGVKLYRLRDGKLIRTLYEKNSGDYNWFTKPAFSLDGKLLTAGNINPDDGVNPIWQVSNGKVLAKMGLYSNPTTADPCSIIRFTGDDKYIVGLVYGTRSEYIAWYRKTLRHAFLQPESYPDERSISAISPVGSLIASIRQDDGILSWTEFDGDLNVDLHWPVEFPANAAYTTFSGDGKVLVAGGDGWCSALQLAKIPRNGIISDTEKGIDGTVKVKKSEVLKDFILRSICTNAQGTIAYLGARDGRIARFDLQTGRATKIWKAGTEPVKGLTLLRNGDLLSFDLKTIRVWGKDGQFKRAFS